MNAITSTHTPQFDPPRSDQTRSDSPRSEVDTETCFHQPTLTCPLPEGASAQELTAARMGFPGLAPKQFGALGEQYAAGWLEERGWTTLTRNWRTRYGELDIVMRTPDLTIVFVEVKARRNARYGSPQEAVTPGKQQNLRRAASDWLLDRRNRVQHAGIRFDVIAITMQEDHPVVHHIANAF